MSGLIVHEWFAQHGGSENVVEQMLAALPGSDLQVLWNDRPSAEVPARETWLARTPLRRHKALSLPFQIPTWRRLHAPKAYDWMLVSSHLFAHHARLAAQPDVPKYVYAHTPARYIWEPDLDQRAVHPTFVWRPALLKPIDRRRAQDATRIAANSEFTRQRIQRAWNRDADVIYPPVDVERIIGVANWDSHLTDEESTVLNSLPSQFLLGASRMVSYKRLDVVISAGEATNLPVVLAGSGPLWDDLSRQASGASVRVDVLHRPSDAMLFALYQRAHALIFPAIEDFGIMPIEAMAAGVPVVAPSTGGAAESVSITGGGATVNAFESSEWRRAVAQVREIDRSGLPELSRRFSRANFRDAITSWLPDPDVSNNEPTDPSMPWSEKN